MSETIHVTDGRQPGFILIDYSLIDQYGSIVGAAPLAVYAVMLRYANSVTSEAWPSIPTVGAKLGLSRNTVRKALLILEAAGLIAAKPLSEKESPTRSTVRAYVILDIPRSVSLDTLALARIRAAAVGVESAADISIFEQGGSNFDRLNFDGGGSEFERGGSNSDMQGGQNFTPNKIDINKTIEQDLFNKIPPSPPRGKPLPPASSRSGGKPGTSKRSASPPADPRVKELLDKVNTIAPIANWGRAVREARPLLALSCAPTVAELFTAYALWIEGRDVVRYGAALVSFQGSAGTLILRVRGVQPCPAATRHETVAEEIARERLGMAARRREVREDEG